MPQSFEAKRQRSLKTTLVDSDDAVFDLLEALLQEVDDNSTAQQAAEPGAAPVEIEVEAPVEPIVVADVAEQPADERVEELAVDNAADVAQQLPGWTREPQQCLLFEVENTLLAIPLIMLDSIAVWDRQAVSMPTQPDWHLGVLPVRGENHVIVDTARLIMPENLTQSAEQRRLEHASHLLIVQQRWALSCNAIRETILLTPDQVKWRPRRPSRRWAVGTLIERLCVLLDTDELIREIEPE